MRSGGSGGESGEGWTGGQYSVARCALAGLLALHLRWLAPLVLGSGPVADATTGLAYVACLALALGWQDRVAALLLFGCWALLFALDPIPVAMRAAVPDAAFPIVGAVLIAHASLPRAPFGSWEARGRPDPDAGWRMRPGVWRALWIVWGLSLVGAGFAGAMSAQRLAGGELAWLSAQALIAPLALFGALRPAVWLGLALLGFAAPGVGVDFSSAHFLFVVFCCDPGWLRGRAVAGKTMVFYDGDCGLCHRAVRVLLAEDRAGERFRFAALQSEAFVRARDRVGSGFENGEPVPDSVLVQRPGEALLARSAGLLEAGQQLGGLWRLVAIGVGLLPEVLVDVAYDAMAKARSHLFAKPEGLCPIVPPHLRERFDS